MEICDNRRNLRSTISDDGTVKNLQGETVGFINDDGNAGDINEIYLGEVTSAGQVIDAKDTILGKVNLGNAEVSSAEGGHYFTVSRGGDLTDSLDGYVGRVENFSYHKLRVIVSYIFFFDEQLVDSTKPTRIVSANESASKSSNTLQIRYAEDKDINIITPFVDDKNERNFSEIQTDLREFLDKKCILVAAMGNKQVGFLLWEMSSLGNKNTWFIHQVFVLPEFRRKGIASSLISHLIGITKPHNSIKKLLSLVPQENAAGIQFHLKNDFKISGNIFFKEGDFRVVMLHVIK